MNKIEVQKAWARSVNNKDYKPYKDSEYGNKVQGKLKAVHYLVYNIVRELPKERGFEPIGEGFNNAKQYLDRAMNNRLYNTNAEEKLLFPFEDTVTIKELRELL